MRFVTLLAVSLFVSHPAFAAWTEYPFKDLGFVVQFPTPPTAATGSYRTVLAPRTSTRIFSVRGEHEWYAAIVADLSAYEKRGASILGEADYWLNLQGDLVSDSSARVEPGKDAVYGREVTVDTRPDFKGGQRGQADAARKWFVETSGMQLPRGSRLTAAVYFHCGHIYMFLGANLPTKEGNQNPDALRFVNSVSFYGADGKRNRDDDPEIQAREGAEGVTGR